MKLGSTRLEELVALYGKRTGVFMGDEDWKQAINAAFPAIAAKLEEQQRVIEAAKKLNEHLLDADKFEGDIPDEIYLPFKDALDKAGEK